MATKDATINRLPFQVENSPLNSIRRSATKWRRGSGWHGRWIGRKRNEEGRLFNLNVAVHVVQIAAVHVEAGQLHRLDPCRGGADVHRRRPVPSSSKTRQSHQNWVEMGNNRLKWHKKPNGV